MRPRSEPPLATRWPWPRCVGEEVVVGSERRAHADGNGLLAHGGVEESRTAPAGEELTHALLEEPHAEHPGVHREQPVGSGRHCKRVREVGAIGGWPETRRDPAPVLPALFIPPGDRETGTLRGWPDKGTTRLRYPRAFTPGRRGCRGATRLRSPRPSPLHAVHRPHGPHD